MVNITLAGGGQFEELGNYARLRRIGDQVFVAGTTAVEPSGRLHAPGDTYAQTRFVLDRIRRLLDECGSSLADVVLTRSYLTDLANAASFLRAHGEVFGGVRPVATAVQAGLTMPGMMIEIEVQALVRDRDFTGTVTIIGGHGRIALQTAPLLVADGYAVRAVIRNPEHGDEVRRTGAEPVVADVERLDVNGLAELLRGSGAVVFAAGAGGRSPDRTRAVDRDAAIRSMTAAEAAGIDRFVMLSYFGAGLDHGVDTDSFRAYAEAKAAADTHLRGTGLAWTVLGPGWLTDDPATGAIEVGTDPGIEIGNVSRADVAAVIAATLKRPGLERKTVEFNNGPTPISEALDRVTPSAGR